MAAGLRSVRHSQVATHQAMAQARRAMAQHRTWARQAQARGMRKARKVLAPRSDPASYERRRDQLRNALAAAVTKPLECSHHIYQTGGAALFFASNWVGSDELARVVLACNTVMPESHRPVVAIFWAEDVIDFVDLTTEPLAQVLDRGRLFIFESSIGFTGGENYAVLPAGFRERDDGPIGSWNFPSAGTFRGKPFLVGRGGAGTFADRSLQSVLAVRPSQFDSTSRQWYWVGRSSDRHESSLRFHVDDLFAPEPGPRRAIELPPFRPAADYSFVPCNLRDAHGDPLGLVDTLAQPGAGIMSIGGTPHLFGRPNQCDQKGRPLLALRGTQSSGGEWVVRFPYRQTGEEIEIEIPANHSLPDGSHWLIRYPNVRDRVNGRRFVLIPLRSADPT